SGRAAQAGVTAAYLAARGFTGIPNVLEAPYGGVLSTFSGEPQLQHLTDGLGERFEILNVGFKPYATAASGHSPLFAVDSLMTENGLEAGDIAEVVIHCSTMAHLHCAWPYEPTGVTAAQMNLFFTAAMMIIDRDALQDQFSEDRLADPAVLAMMTNIKIEVDPRYDAGGDATRHCARVLIVTGDGRRFEREVTERPGSPENPLSPAALQHKFETLAGDALPPAQIVLVPGVIAVLEEVDARTLTDLVTVVAPA